MQTLPLDTLHRSLGARMVPFAGYEMPLQYDGIIAEHLACRSGAALFDVSHMGQVLVADAAALEQVAPGDFRFLKPGRQRYGLLLNAAGGILDDMMVANFGDRLQLVLNASNKAMDLAYLRGAGVPVEAQFGRALLALQGPHAAAVLPEAATLTFMDAADVAVAGVRCAVTRSGYTGEDGFEIGCEPGDAPALARTLLDRGARPAGLGARDSLRLEAGLPLHGNDIGPQTDPIAAGLGFAIAKRRRLDWDFVGGAAVRTVADHGPAERLVGLRLEGRAPARTGAEIRLHGAPVGRVTSGLFSPSLNAPIAMGYVRADLAVDGTRLDLIVRDRALPGAITPLPFLPHRYHR